MVPVRTRLTANVSFHQPVAPASPWTDRLVRLHAQVCISGAEACAAAGEQGPQHIHGRREQPSSALAAAASSTSSGLEQQEKLLTESDLDLGGYLHLRPACHAAACSPCDAVRLLCLDRFCTPSHLD
jgi:hypothetical protein